MRARARRLTRDSPRTLSLSGQLTHFRSPGLLGVAKPRLVARSAVALEWRTLPDNDSETSMSFAFAFKRLALAAACAGVTVAASAGVSVRFSSTDPTATPFPSDRFTVRDWSNNTFRRVNLPLPSDCVSTTAKAAECADIAVINELDGFSTQPRVTIPFSGPINPASVTSDTVYFINLGDTLSLRGFGQRVGINQVVWDPATNTLVLQPDDLLQQHSRYLLVVTNGVRDASGQRIEDGRFIEDNARG